MLRKQVEGSFELLTEVIGETSDSEWSTPAASAQNTAGFSVWHCARVIDWAVNCALRGVPELANEPRWRQRLRPDAWFGYDVSLETAHDVAATVSRHDVLEYLVELQPNVMSWFDSASEADLDEVPDIKGNYESNGMYMAAPRVQTWIEEDAATPVWRMIAGPCVGHVRSHLGEVRALLQVLRA